MAKKHGGHHGGAWKVAYADFVTAMMALFLVLWLTSQDQRIKIAIERSFRNPFASLTKESVGILPSKDTQAVKSEKGNFDSASAVELNFLRRLNQDLMMSLQGSGEEKLNDSVRMDMVSEGLRISIFDRGKKPVFEPESMQLTPYGDWVLSTLAWDISRYTNFLIDLEGHTETGHKAKSEDYGSWELSTDRANTARRALLKHGVSEAQISKVAGYGESQPLKDRPGTDESNRRVTVLLKISEFGKNRRK